MKAKIQHISAVFKLRSLGSLSPCVGTTRTCAHFLANWHLIKCLKLFDCPDSGMFNHILMHTSPDLCRSTTISPLRFDSFLSIPTVMDLTCFLIFLPRETGSEGTQFRKPEMSLNKYSFYQCFITDLALLNFLKVYVCQSLTHIFLTRNSVTQ